MNFYQSYELLIKKESNARNCLEGNQSLHFLHENPSQHGFGLGSKPHRVELACSRCACFLPENMLHRFIDSNFKLSLHMGVYGAGNLSRVYPSFYPDSALATPMTQKGWMIHLF